MSDTDQTTDLPLPNRTWPWRVEDDADIEALTRRVALLRDALFSITVQSSPRRMCQIAREALQQ